MWIWDWVHALCLVVTRCVDRQLRVAVSRSEPHHKPRLARSGVSPRGRKEVWPPELFNVSRSMKASMLAPLEALLPPKSVSASTSPIHLLLGAKLWETSVVCFCWLRLINGPPTVIKLGKWQLTESRTVGVNPQGWAGNGADTDLDAEWPLSGVRSNL